MQHLLCTRPSKHSLRVRNHIKIPPSSLIGVRAMPSKKAWKNKEAKTSVKREKVLSAIKEGKPLFKE